MHVEHDKSNRPFFKAENGTCLEFPKQCHCPKSSQIASPEVLLTRGIVLYCSIIPTGQNVHKLTM